jgi:ABC-2 type transport system ATP-binding protein
MIATNGFISQNIIQIDRVTRRFGNKKALDEVNFTVPQGVVCGLVGVNGAGKTTLIKHILGLLRAQSGQVRVFGLDPVKDPVGVLSRIGYLSEEPDLPGWMRVDELFRYTSAFYPNWDHSYAEELRREFDLDPKSRVRNLSKGQRARAGLVIALAYRPELLLLDEPSSGLDPIVRRDILAAIIRTIAEEGRTVLFSSHLLSEVERVSDRVAMIRSGKILFCDSLDRIKESHTRLAIHFEEPQPIPPMIDGVLTWTGEGREWTAICSETTESLSLAEQMGAKVVGQSELPLEEIFVAYAQGNGSFEREENG